MLIWGAPLLQYPITLLGRQRLDKHPDTRHIDQDSVFIHYAMMNPIGVDIFTAILLAEQRPGTLPVPRRL